MSPRIAAQGIDDLRDLMNLKEVGRRLDAVRVASTLDKKDFAATVGIDKSSYSKIIQGNKALKIEMGYMVSERWGVSLDFLYKGSLDNLPSNLSKDIIDHLKSAKE